MYYIFILKVWCFKIKSNLYINIKECILWLHPHLPMGPFLRYSHLSHGKTGLINCGNIPSTETVSSKVFPHKTQESSIDEPRNQYDFFPSEGLKKKTTTPHHTNQTAYYTHSLPARLTQEQASEVLHFHINCVVLKFGSLHPWTLANMSLTA